MEILVHMKVSTNNSASGDVVVLRVVVAVFVTVFVDVAVREVIVLESNRKDTRHPISCLPTKEYKWHTNSTNAKKT